MGEEAGQAAQTPEIWGSEGVSVQRRGWGCWGGTFFPPHIHMRLRVHTPLLWLCRLPVGAQAEGLAGAGDEGCRGDERGDSSPFLPKLLPGRTDPESESASGSPQRRETPGSASPSRPPAPAAGARESPVQAPMPPQPRPLSGAALSQGAQPPHPPRRKRPSPRAVGRLNSHLSSFPGR